VYVKTLNITEFRRQCLDIVDRLPADGLLITKRGEPVAKLVPVPSSCADLIGSLPRLITKSKDNLFSTGIKWNAES